MKPVKSRRADPGLVVIVGAGLGLGASVARACARADMNVAMAARNTDKLVPLIEEISALGPAACAYGCDATRERSVSRLFDSISADLGVPNLVIYNVEHFIPGTILDIEVFAFEECWRAMCLGGFIVGREASKRMISAGRGTIIYTGATASLRGRDRYINLAVGKFGVRALAQAMARELGPRGIHVAHIIIDGGILSSRSPHDARENASSLFPDEIAQTILHVHQQHKSAWTQELDLRPWTERF